MSSEREDFIDAERLRYNEARPRSTQTVAIQSATLPDNWPAVTVFDVGSADKVQFLPAEVSSVDKEMEFFVLDTNSANLILKNASGDVKAIVPPGGYAKLVCVKGVWRAGPGNAYSTFSQISIAASYATPGFNSGVSAVGFSSVTEATNAWNLLAALAQAARARGWGV